MAKFIVGSSAGIFEALHRAGVIAEDPDCVARCVVDLRVGEPAYIYVQKFADDSLGDILAAGLSALPDD